MFCAFKNLREMEKYWDLFEKENGNMVEISQIYVSSSENALDMKKNFCGEALV